MMTTYNENPSPTSKTSETVHLHQAVGKDTGESRRHTTNQVKDGISLLELESRVPAGKKTRSPRQPLLFL